jgi:hypothetical protein
VKTKMTSSESVALAVIACSEVPLDGWVFSKLWRWFAMPFGVPAVGVWRAVGIILLVRYVTSRRKTESQTFDENVGDLVGSAVWALMCLLIGWIVYLCGR